MKYIGSVGIGGVLSEIGLMSKTKPFRVSEKELINKLCQRFEIESFEAVEAIRDTEDENLIERIYISDDDFLIGVML